MGREQDFVAHLYALAAGRETNSNARADLAALRRGVGKAPGEVPELYPIVERFLSPTDRGWEEERFYLVGSLFALHQNPWRDAPRWTNLGTSFRTFLDGERRAKGVEAGGSLERRFAALLDCDREELPNQLRGVITLLHDTPIEWYELLHGLRWWGANRNTQHNWARQFYRSQREETANPDETTNGIVEPAA